MNTNYIQVLSSTVYCEGHLEIGFSVEVSGSDEAHSRRIRRRQQNHIAGYRFVRFHSYLIERSYRG